MRSRILGAVVLAALLAAPALARPGRPASGPGVAPGATSLVLPSKQGDAYCFQRAVTIHGVVLAGGRCYTFYALNTASGAFLGVGPAGPPMIPPGQLVRLNTPAGAKHKGRLFYLIPLRAQVIGVPVNVMQFVTVQFSLAGGRLIFALPWGGQLYRLRSDDSGVPEGPER
ncbi:MAG: hypothetical protein QN159_02875 [Armatimonadota bacterium]|nr:hypothetical protein [Armatimonadota bacterium]